MTDGRRLSFRIFYRPVVSYHQYQSVCHNRSIKMDAGTEQGIMTVDHRLKLRNILPNSRLLSPTSISVWPSTKTDAGAEKKKLPLEVGVGWVCLVPFCMKG